MSELTEVTRQQARPGVRLQRCAVAALLALALLLVPLVTNDYTQYVVNSILVYALAAVGFNVVLGYLGQLAFANAAFFGIGAYTVALLMHYAALPFPLALGGSAVTGALVGLVVGLPALRLKGYYLAIVTLVFGELMRWAYVHGGDITKGSGGLPVPEAAMFGVVADTDKAKYYVILAVVAAVIWSTNRILRSRVGRAFVAIRENELACASLGISPGRYKVIAFVWSGLVVAVAGGLFAILLGRISPESFNLHQLLLHFAIVMIGGIGSLVGSIMGAVLLTAAPEILRNFPGLEEIIFSLLLIAVLLFLPRGLAGLAARLVPALKERLYRE
jgi:branched-chain amino acid transport system permease protein